LPKSPTKYNPFNKTTGQKAVLGYFSIKDMEGKEYPYESVLKTDIDKQFRAALQQANFADKTTSTAVINYLLGLASFTVTSEGKTYVVKYENGRKDVVLGRMFEDKYITAEELKKAFEEGIDIKERLDSTSKTSTFKIKAPHFVFRIKDLLQKQYGEDVAKKGWIVTTTLDYCTPDKDNKEICNPGIQQNAEQIITSNATELARYGA